MKNIEVEIRSFVSKNRYAELDNFFKKNGKFLGEEKQITYYFSGKDDLRIQQSDEYSKIWLKSGKLHDEARKETEIKFAKKDFESLYNLFFQLGYKKEIEWRRIRKKYIWKKIKVMLDYSAGYGYIVEMEIMTNRGNKNKALKLLKERFDELSINVTLQRDFDKKFIYYKNNWQQLLKNKDV